MLLEALVACAGVTLKSVATAVEVPLKMGTCSPRAISISAARSASTRRRRSASREIRLRFEVGTDAPQDKLDLLLKLTERYCVVYQTIKNGPKVSVIDEAGLSLAYPPLEARVAHNHRRQVARS